MLTSLFSIIFLGLPMNVYLWWVQTQISGTPRVVGIVLAVIYSVCWIISLTAYSVLISKKLNK